MSERAGADDAWRTVVLGDLALDLPGHARDASTLCFVLPGARTFAPTVVVKRDRLGEHPTLAAYVAAEARALAGSLAGFEVVEPPAPDEADPGLVRFAYAWGRDPMRLRQDLVARRWGPDDGVLLVTTTRHAEALDDQRPALERLAASVRPAPEAGAR